MAIPELNKQNILDALQYIDENGVPEHNQSMKYELIKDGKHYPPKYVAAVAAHLATGAAITTEGFHSTEANKCLQALGFQVETKQEKFQLTISADRVVSTDPQFTMDDLNLGNRYQPLDVYFQKADGTTVRRKCEPGEMPISNKTLPRLACQLFERQIAALSPEEKETFPICKYTPDSDLLCGIYPSVDAIQQGTKTIAYCTYNYGDGQQFVIRAWNLFSTLLFAQECLKRFAAPGEQFILTYREKEESETSTPPEADPPEPAVYRNSYSTMLIQSKNLIFHGAPGTGKSYLAKEIAADIISRGCYDKDSLLTEDQKKQMEFVQFHPSYDYSDFVEGLRPKVNADGTMGFELRDGVFKAFAARARADWESAKRTGAEPKKYVFIIDEINRGEISKIFGELFFAIDPGYRGRAGAVSTQYANLHEDPDEKFFVPENLYIIGTMNDIDRSVDSFDFAMRRRFRFVELKADEHPEKILASLEAEKRNEAIRRMATLNRAIADTEDLNENYQIGAAYFLKLKTMDFDQLWTDQLAPLLKEYVQGMYKEGAILARFAKAYHQPPEDSADEAPES